MYKLKELLLLSLCLFASSIVAGNPQDNDVMLKKQLAQLIEEYHIPGAVLTYGFANQPLHTIAVGVSNIQHHTPMENEMLFDGGSISKSMTAAVILQLVQEKKLQLDKKLGDMQFSGNLKILLNKYPALKLMTVRQLLNHTSGIPQSVNTKAYKIKFSEDPKRYWTAEELIEQAMQVPVYFAPGIKGAWSYTNTDYVLLALIIENITHQSMEKNYITMWQRAGVKNIYYASRGMLPASLDTKLATGYLIKGSTFGDDQPFKNLPLDSLNQVKMYRLKNAYNTTSPGASGVFIDSISLAEWYRTLFQTSFLSMQSQQAMLTTIHNTKENEGAYGLGVATHNIPHYGFVISHDGLTPGYTVIGMYFVKYHLVLTLMTNSSNPYVSTFNVNNGKIIPGVITKVLPLIIK